MREHKREILFQLTLNKMIFSSTQMTKNVTEAAEETSKLCDAAGNKINTENSVLCL